MAQQAFDNRNTGVLFKNENKANDRQPDYNGRLDIEGTEIKLAAWVRTAKSTGKKFLSLRVDDWDKRKPAANDNGQRTRPQREPQRPAPQSASRQDDFDDDIPF